jgi:predicted  nucleic acid-binding Zn-ribbon protein
MKKVLLLLAFVSVLTSLSAQKVNETVIIYGKDQLKGFTVNITGTSASIVADALNAKLEKEFSLKGSKKKGFYVYENQPCVAFGDARYDIYFTTADVGKKNNQFAQVTLVVSTGNFNCITFSNDPRTSRNIVAFLENLTNDVEKHKATLRIAELKSQLTTLDKERQSLLKDQAKIQEKLNAGNDEIKRLSDQLDKKNEEIEKLQDSYNKSHDAAVKEQITAAVKERQTIHKSHNSTQKSLLSLNKDLQKVKTKLDANQKQIDAAEAEIKSLEHTLEQ